VPIGALDHVAVPVTDLAASRRFYEQVLGLEEDPGRPDVPVAGAWLNLPGGGQVHLFVTAEGHPAGIGHFALSVTDLDALVAGLTAAGVGVRVLPQMTAARQAFLVDPDGNRIELNEAPVGS